MPVSLRVLDEPQSEPGIARLDREFAAYVIRLTRVHCLSFRRSKSTKVIERLANDGGGGGGGTGIIVVSGTLCPATPVFDFRDSNLSSVEIHYKPRLCVSGLAEVG